MMMETRGDTWGALSLRFAIAELKNQAGATGIVPPALAIVRLAVAIVRKRATVKMAGAGSVRGVERPFP